MAKTVPPELPRLEPEGSEGYYLCVEVIEAALAWRKATKLTHPSSHLYCIAAYHRLVDAIGTLAEHRQ